MTPPLWFVLTLLTLNAGASLTFAARQSWGWCLIYGGAAIIQTGSWLVLR